MLIRNAKSMFRDAVGSRYACETTNKCQNRLYTDSVGSERTKLTPYVSSLPLHQPRIDNPTIFGCDEAERSVGRRPFGRARQLSILMSTYNLRSVLLFGDFFC